MTRREIISIIRNVFYAMRRPHEYLVDDVVFRYFPEMFGETYEVNNDSKGFTIRGLEGHWSNWNNRIVLCEDRILDQIEDYWCPDLEDVKNTVQHILLHERRHTQQEDLGINYVSYDEAAWEVNPRELDAEDWANAQQKYVYR